MELDLVTKNDLEIAIRGVKKEFEEKLTLTVTDLFKATWIESKEVPKMLGISAKTWQNWRDRKVIPFSQFGAKIYVNINDIHRAFENRRDGVPTITM